jgi:hypothetical protein
MDQDSNRDRELILDDLISLAEEVDRILEGVNYLLDLTYDHVERLKRVSEGPLTITKFKTSLNEFDYWMSRVNKDIKDVGLNENYEYLIIRSRYAWAVEGIRNYLVTEESLNFKRTLNEDTDMLYYLAIRSKSGFFSFSSNAYLDLWLIGYVLIGSSLDNGIDAPRQEFDRILSEHYSISAPAVAMELGLSQYPLALRSSSYYILQGFMRVAKLIIMVDIIPQSGQTPSLEDNFDLTDEEIKEIDPDDLCGHALDWYHERGIHLVEDFDVTVHAWSGENHQRGTHIRFRHNNWTLTESVPNIQFHPMMPLHNGEHERVDVEFPLRELVKLLQQRWSDVEYTRIAEFIAEKQAR